MNNVMLHVHNSGDGPIPFSIMEISVALPQFFHSSLYLDDREERGTVQMLNDSGIQVLHGRLSKDVLRQINPAVVVLHDISGDKVEGRPWKWLKGWRTISFHHSAVRPTVPTDFHVFTSDTVQRQYLNLLKSGFITRWGTIPIELSTSTEPWFRRKMDDRNIAGIKADLLPILLGIILNVPFHPTPKPPETPSIWGDRKPMLPMGVLVGCGSEQEWMLPWWWENYKKHNTLPVLFIDMGEGDKAMTPGMKDWCKERGYLAPLHLPLAGWFQKPFAFAKTVFEESVWTDVDCEIRGSLEPAFDYCKFGIAAAEDPYYKLGGKKTVPISLNSGVVAFKFGNEIISKWCDTITREGKDYRDDQIILNVMAHQNPGKVGILPRKFNWLRLDGDTNPEAVCIHWTGGKGKEIIRAKMEGKYLREHFIADFVNALGWRRGLEIGSWRGRTFLHLLKSCPKLAMTTIDMWEPQPANPGPERYTLEEDGRWNHVENEAFVRAEAAKYGDRAEIFKGNSRDIVPNLKADYDFAFIDGDHGSEAVEADIRNALWKMKLNGFLFGHDINWPSVKEVVEKVFTRYMTGPDNLWYVSVSDVFGPLGCPRGDVGEDGPPGAKEG